MDVLAGILSVAVLAGGVLALGALGEVLSERVGVVNLGVEGLMSLGAVVAIIVVLTVPNVWLGLLGALATGFVFGAIFAVATVVVRANQILCGLALTLIGTGLAATIGKPFSSTPAPVTFEPIIIPVLSDLPIVGRGLFSQNILVYIIYFALPIALHYLMFKTRHGLNLRAVGENPAAADAAGIPVRSIRFWYVAAGGALASAAGAYLTLAYIPSWSDGVVAGRGWIAVALVIFAGYRPIGAVIASLLFGVITALGFVGQARNWPIPSPVLSMLPYLGTIALMIAPALAWRRLWVRLAAPAALGTPYFRDER
jgi:simple sugar transport system permease protein